jgi:EcsC protein family
MSTPRRGRHQALTDYEADEAREIASWKSTPPSPLSEIWKMIVVPVAQLVERVVPDPIVRMSIERAFDAAALLSGQRDIQRQAGVSELSELHRKPLEECDRLANRVGIAAKSMAGVEGVVTGLGGVWTTLLDIPLLFGLALRTIIRIGHCYGYPLDQWKDRPFILGVFIVATAGSLQTRRDWLNQLRDLEKYLLAETQVSLVKEEILAFLFQLEVFEEVPGIGAVTGGVLNLTFMQRVEVTARRIFQERWLTDTGKIESAIQPADGPARQLAAGWGGAVGRAVYGGAYYFSYGASFPFWLAASALPAMDNALTRGLKDGARAAVAAAMGDASGNGKSAALPAVESRQSLPATA